MHRKYFLLMEIFYVAVWLGRSFLCVTRAWPIAWDLDKKSFEKKQFEIKIVCYRESCVLHMIKYILSKYPQNPPPTKT